MHFIPGLRLRASEEAEILGIDDAEMGEFAYDYVGLEQEIGHTLEPVVAKSSASRSSNEKAEEPQEPHPTQ
jgi:Amt family ammonium transporter